MTVLKIVFLKSSHHGLLANAPLNAVGLLVLCRMGEAAVAH